MAKLLSDRWLPLLAAGVVVCAMVGVSWGTGLREAIFPETLALLCGEWILRRPAWNADRPRVLALMGIGACVGVVLNLLVPVGVWGRAVLAYAICGVCLGLAWSDLTPMLSAAILPILLGTRSWLYVVVVLALVFLVCLGQDLLERLGWRDVVEPTRRRVGLAADARLRGLRLVAFALASAPFYLTGNKLFCVPPLVVAFTSLSTPSAPGRLRPVRAWASLALAGVIGACGRLAVGAIATASGGVDAVPGTAGGIVAGLVVLAACYVLLVLTWGGLDTWLPPAGAVVLLAFLIPGLSPLAYALEVAAGAALWVGLALLLPGVRPSA